MKFLLCFFSIFLFVHAFSAIAADDTRVKGTVGRIEKLLPLTDKYLEEALKISDECKSYEFTNTRYNCDCVGMTFLQLRRKQGHDASAFWLREDAQRKCPNTPAMAGMMYSQCVGWAPFKRGEDYQEFCSCYGSEFAKNYGKNPSENQFVVEAQMTKAMSKCNSNSVNERIQDQNAFIDSLKEKGLYEKYFPGAGLDE